MNEIESIHSIRTPANIIERQLATSLPLTLEKAISTLEWLMERGSPDQRLQAAKLIINTATTIAKIKT